MQFRNVNEALPSLARDLLTTGAEDDSRAGKTKELTFQHITITEPLVREIVIPGRKANIAAQITETMWVLAGRNDVEWLSHYLPRAADFSDDGTTWRAGYGPRLRKWRGFDDTDQLMEVIALLREEPTTRRAVMSIWDPASDLQPSKDIPCNDWLHFLARDGVLDLHVATRSNDLIWGWSGINQFEWSVLLEVVAAYTGLRPGRIHYAISSLHIYDRHWEMAAGLKVGSRFTQKDVRFSPGENPWDDLVEEWFAIEGSIRHGGGRYGGGGWEAQITRFPEPMLRQWLYVLAWWWGHEGFPKLLEGQRLHEAIVFSTSRAKDRQQVTDAARKAGAVVRDMRPPVLGDPDEMAVQVPTVTYAGPDRPSFIDYVVDLHNEKHAAYGDSWKRRGETLGIMANIARKVDRLGGGATADETSADTAIDLLVYLAKYRVWLNDIRDAVEVLNSDGTAAPNKLLRQIADQKTIVTPLPRTTYEESLKEQFERLTELVERKAPRAGLVDAMIANAYQLARVLWS